MKKNITIILVTTLLLFTFTTPTVQAALTDEQILAILGLLSSFGVDETTISNVSLSLRGLSTQAQQSTSTGIVGCVNLSRTSRLGLNDFSTNGEISRLQQFLTDEGDYTFGEITGFFGLATQDAVQKWQEKNEVVSSGSPDTTGFGVVGPKTRRAMACESSSATTSNVTDAVTQTIRKNDRGIVEIITTTLSPSCSLSVTSATISVGDPTTIVWDTTRAIYIEDENGKNDPQGSVTVVPDTFPYTYSITAFGPGGFKTCAIVLGIVSTADTSTASTNTTSAVTTSSSVTPTVTATLKSAIFPRNSQIPTLSGTASGIDLLGISLDDNSGNIFESGIIISVVDGNWSYGVPIPLVPDVIYIFKLFGSDTPTLDARTLTISQ